MHQNLFTLTKNNSALQQLSWEQTSNPSQPRPLQKRSQEESKLEFPCNSIARRLAPAPLNQTGGDGRNRTDDPLLAKQVLYQLSYIPSLARRAAQGSAATKLMVGQGGLEPPTPRLSSVCSNQLSY